MTLGPIAVLDYRRPGIGRLRRVRTFGEEASKVATLALVFVHYGLRASPEKGAHLFFLIGLLLWVGLATTIVTSRLLRGGGVSRPTRVMAGWRVALATLLLATLASFVVPLHTAGRRTCDHGLRWANNQLGIAWSDNGGPCGNGRRARSGRAWRLTKHWYVYLPQ